MQKVIKTEILSQNISSIRKATQYLSKNELVSFPTETVYGLGASAISNTGVAKIFAVKGRPKYNPLIVHIADYQDAYRLALVPKHAQILMENFWPGPLTLVLKQKKTNQSLASLITGNLGTIAVRVPMHKTARALITEFGHPIAAPSANISGRISPTRAKDVLSNMDGKIAAIIEGDDCSIGLESTIINLSEDEPVILRPGGIPRETIEAKLGHPLKTYKQSLGNKPKIKAPGMLETHYAPNCELKLNQRNPKTNELFLGFGYMPPDILGLNLSQSGDLTEAASNYFATLTDIDAMATLMKFKTVSVAPIPNFGLGVTINDRLKRAATPQN